MSKDGGLNVAVVGATGAAGQIIVQLLETRNYFPLNQLKLLSGNRGS